MEKLHFMIIDPQVDFCDPKGALSIPDADQDMARLAALIKRLGPKIQDIHCTLDTHHFYDISHPIFWVDSEGGHPAPFTIISQTDVKDGVFRAVNPQYQDYAREYVKRLAANHRYPLCIWPPHCLIGSPGHNVFPVLFEALLEWEQKQIGMVDYVTKGSNFRTEHYSAVQADVPDPADPSTALNTGLIQILEQADIIALAGEAASHCLKFTVEDIADTFDDAHIRKMVLLEDCCSAVPGFEKQAEEFVTNMTARGMQISDSKRFLT